MAVDVPSEFKGGRLGQTIGITTESLRKVYPDTWFEFVALVQSITEASDENVQKASCGVFDGLEVLEELGKNRLLYFLEVLSIGVAGHPD
eukprot:15438045-Alexandrium_andersonii.AAC.1